MNTINVHIGDNNNRYDINLVPGMNVYTGIKPFENEFGKATTLEIDLLNLASGIYATDLAIKRHEREHYIRSISITIDVINYHAFQRIKNDLERALYVVSKDNWTINFEQASGVADSNFQWQQSEGAVLLFSGGLDSMCAAADFINKDNNLVLVSHNTQGNRIIDDCQRNIHEVIEKYYNKKIKHIHIKVYGRNHDPLSFPTDNERENTQRTRSFLFLSLAALVTRRCGFNKVLYMAENGQFAIHLPLNQARVGPFSTHTADPEFVLLARDIFRTLLDNINFQIENPFLYYTKAEVFQKLPRQLQEQAYYSVTCWMIARTPGNKHCGYCIPCISRRIALEYNKIQFREYANDIFTMDLKALPDTDDKKRNLIDYILFIMKFKDVTEINKGLLMSEFPELFNPVIDVNKTLNLYMRVASQSFSVLNSYSEMVKLIG